MLNTTDFDRSVLLDDLSGELNVEFKLSVSGVNLLVTTSSVTEGSKGLNQESAA